MLDFQFGQFPTLFFLHLSDQFYLSIIFIFLNFFPFRNLKIPLINQPLTFSFSFPHIPISFLLSIWIFGLKFIKSGFMIDEFRFRVQKFFRKIRYLDFNFTIFVLKLVANKLSLFSNWKQVIIITWYHKFVYCLTMGLDFIYLFWWVQRVFCISDRTYSIFYVRTIQKYFMTV